MHKLYLYVILVIGIAGYLVLGRIALDISEGIHKTDKQENVNGIREMGKTK
jgi:hypothetical protein